MEKVLWGNPIDKWFMAAGIGAAACLALLLARNVLGRRLRSLAGKTENIIDDLMLDLLRHHTKSWFIIAIALFAAASALTLPEKAFEVLKKAVVVTTGLQILLWGSKAVDYYIRHSPKLSGGKDKAASSTYSIITFISKLFIWVIVVLLTLHNLGINVTALVAGLGVGGVAMALALQNILGDLFASMSIVLDKPFEIGDTIVVDSFTGTVEQVGLKTTRLRSLSGEQLVFSNADLLRSRIRNFKRMGERRVVFTLGVPYGTPREKLAAIPGILREIVQRQPKVRFDRAHLARLGEFSVVFEVAYFVLDADYNLSMDIQQAINLGVAERFEREGISFAYPTQTVVLAKD